MPSPIREQLILALQARLLAMSVSGGYYFDSAAGSVSVDPTLNILTSAPGGMKPFYVIQPELGGVIKFYPASQLYETVPLSVMGRYEVDESDPTAKLKAWERMGADLEKAIAENADGSAWWGTLATDARIGEVQPWVAIGSPVVLVVRRLECRIYRGYGQPSS